MARKRKPKCGHCIVDGMASREEVVIYITREAYQRLCGDESWDNMSMAYRLHPSEQYPMRTRVARMTLRDGLFYPGEYWGLRFKEVSPPYETKK